MDIGILGVMSEKRRPRLSALGSVLQQIATATREGREERSYGKRQEGAEGLLKNVWQELLAMGEASNTHGCRLSR